MKIPSIATLDDLIQALRNRLTFAENFRGIEILISDSGAADTEFTVTHSLGKTPRHYIYNLDKAGIVYDSRRTSWTDKVMYLKCSQANSKIYMTVL